MHPCHGAAGRGVVLLLAATLLKAAGGQGGDPAGGDPPPGRSPGPPQPPPAALAGDVEGSLPTLPPALSPDPETDPYDDPPPEEVIVNRIDATFSDYCETADLNNEANVKILAIADSGLNISVEHSMFKTEAELVRGVTYRVVLGSLGTVEEIEDFFLESTLNGEARGLFWVSEGDVSICNSSIHSMPLLQHPNTPISQARRKALFRGVNINKTNHEQFKIEEYDINTERNDLPVWDSPSTETKNEILNDFKLEHISDKIRKSKIRDGSSEVQVKLENTNSTVQYKIPTDAINNSNSRERDDSINDADNDDLSVYDGDGDHLKNRSEIKEKRSVSERDATNYIYSSDDGGKLSGYYVDGGHGAFEGGEETEVVKGNRVYGRLSKDRRKTQLSWTMTEARVGEVRTTNVTFRLRYRRRDDPIIYQVLFTRLLKTDCQLTLYRRSGRVGWSDLPRGPADCQVLFPSTAAHRHGLLVTLERLNVPCQGGGFVRLNPGAPPALRTRTAQQSHLCGKLEELPDSDRNFYFAATQSESTPYLHLHGGPYFVLSYRLVDYCYNVTLTARNGSFEIQPTNSLHCTFKIHLPFGNRVALRIQMGEKTIKAVDNPSDASTQSDSSKLQEVETEFSAFPETREAADCSGLSIKLWDGENSWVHCSKTGDPLRNVQITSKQNSVIMYVVVRRKKVDSDLYDSVRRFQDDYNKNEGVMRLVEGHGGGVHKRSADEGGWGVRLWYHAEAVEDAVGPCSYGWVRLRQLCVTLVAGARLPWAQAEAECVRQAGHLVSVRSEQDQAVLDQLLLLSPEYRDHSAYWIGASDKASEGDFRWTDGLPFTFTHWFPGWAAHGGYNRQPNDDGLSGQDCVEVRRAFSPPAPARPQLAPSFRWNDRDCGAPNHFVCERPLADEPVEGGACERAVALGRARPRAAVASPGFPRAYPDGARCRTDVTAPPGYRIVLDFEELVLEQEPDCSYDYLEIWEPHAGGGRRLCGDWSARLKLLRHVSAGPRLTLSFVSDYSHHYTGFKATLTMESVMECSDDRQKLFNDSCYLIVSYPEVTWHTAQQICGGARATLAAVLSAEEQHFLTAAIRNSAEYSNSAVYWLGAKVAGLGTYEWTDGTRVAFSGWLPGRAPEERDILELPDPQSPTCLGVTWQTSPTPMLPSGLYWTSQKCDHVGGYVCKRKNQMPEPNLKLNKTVNDTEGRITSPNYPGSYPNNLDYNVKLVGPENTRLVIQFSKIDIEYQKDCLYDFVEVRSVLGGAAQGDTARLCGSHDTDMRRFDFVSLGSSAVLHVRSDYAGAGAGFSARWRTVDVSACPGSTLTARAGQLRSPNWPHFLLAGLSCEYTILAPLGKRVWLEITDHSLGEMSSLEVVLGPGSGPGTGVVRPFQSPGRLADGAFLSFREKLIIRLRTGSRPVGAGFTATYKTVGIAVEERILELGNATSGQVLHVNEPLAPPAAADLSLRLLAPPGYTVLLRLHHVIFGDGPCRDKGSIEVYDNYADTNGTWWGLCEADGAEEAGPPIAITSYLNSLRLRTRSTTLGVRLNATVTTQMDVNYRTKIMQGSQESAVESCKPNPCLNGGRCLASNGRSSCQCEGHFTGMFCALSACELEPCVFGACVLTAGGHRCACRAGYTGAACEARVRPCEARPCDNRGRCVERASGFHCNCYAWWEGTRCERRMMNIPYKPLSERMLQEPFWLGLITVFVVLAAIGLVWCAKRHFPEKIEKLLSEEADRNRGPNQLSVRGAGAREGAACGAGAGGGGLAVAAGSGGGGAAGAPGGPGGAARGSLFNRLGIRKPSILSLSAGLAAAHAPPAARTFSLDDLLRPPPRRTPSPRKKRNNSTPTKKNAAEKKQILQQLISPAARQNNARKVSMVELIQISERRAKESEEGKLSEETDFCTSETTADVSVHLSDPKLEKKVTFARLLNKVSAEMSSGSEIEIGNLAVQPVVKSSSTPPSPGGEYRSPHSTSSNQGSDSISSLETALPGMGLRRYSGRANKISSADSILAMFRNFSSTSTGLGVVSSGAVSPSTTPSASSPQDEVAGDDDSTTSSVHTPVSFTSGPPDSPVFYRQANSHSSTIEVPVLDALTAHRANMSGGNLLHPPTILLEIPSSNLKCLSPIRELPTPLPSPALTPIMHRSHTSSADYDELGMDVSDDRISLEIPCACDTEDEDDDDDDDDDDGSNQDISVIPREGVASSPIDIARPGSGASGLRLKMRQPVIGRDTPTPSTQMTDDTPSPLLSHDSERELSSSCGRTTASPRDCSPSRPALIIPLLTVEQPSPTRHYPTGLMFAGSPPPQRASIGETSFHFPNKQQQKRLLKEYDKPNSLDLAMVPPQITITCNMSEAESDAESVSPAARAPGQSLAPPGPSAMCYLSPFSVCIRGDRTTSESNLSSSGYSSMASPGPSRCGSNNPLCPSEMEDPGPGSGPTNLHPHRRPSPLVKTNSNPTTGTAVSGNNNDQKGHSRGRSDSETLSDDPLLESNDEGISTDHLEERIEDGELKSAKELEVFLKNEAVEAEKIAAVPALQPSVIIPPKCISNCSSIEKGLDRLSVPSAASSKMSLLLPSIVIQADSSPNCEKILSPVSSRSESPLSDRTIGLGRFSPHFYGRHKEQLPFTDSDGLYDFPSSDCVHQSSGSSNKVNAGAPVQSHRKSTGRRRERKNSRANAGSKTPSPTKAQLPHSLQNLLDVPGKESYFRTPAPRKLSPKRRSRSQQPVSSSSSSESINSAREVTVRLTPEAKSPQTSDPGVWPKQEWAAEASGEETGEDASIRMLPKSPVTEELPKPVRKISRMRTIGHQIRFLRRLEQSLKQRERFTSIGNSDEEGDESSSVTSPLLQQNRSVKPQIRKSSSIGRIQQPVATTPAVVRPKQPRQKKGPAATDALLAQDSLWRGNLGMAGPNDISD